MSVLSLIVPCLNEEEAIPIFYDAVMGLQDELKALGAQLEFCFVDDGSTDGTLALLRELQKKDERVHYVSFSRNFGKEAGLLAGLETATGDFAAVMDVDMQDPPSLLPEMLRRLTESDEYDCIATRRATRKGEPPIRSMFARMFYKIINRMSETEIVDGARDFRMMRRVMVDAIVSDPERSRFSKGLFSWVGFKTYWISYDNIERSAGKTKWSFWKLFKYSLDGIVGYSSAPLYFSALAGIVLCVIAFLCLIFVVVRALIFGDPVAGWPSLASIIIFLGGLLLFSNGIMGLYLAKIYVEAKGRPVYIVREKK